ncbi:MAG TPA: D-Ala-D-Ala carboxypeptidase family metallohydrolase [Allocoleopsis sp.]
MENTITATRDTWLKKQPKQSSELDESQKKAVPKGTEYPVEKYDYDRSNNHYQVVLGYGAGTWFIYDTSGADSHWDCSWEDKTEDDKHEQPVNIVPPHPPSAAKPTKNIITTPGQINWADASIYISEYFTTTEVTKNNPKRFPKPNSNEERNILALAKELDKLREDWGSGLVVTSWFRPGKKLGYEYDVNKEIGGASNSQHIYGRGVDIYPSNGELQKLQDLCLQNWRGGVGKGVPKGFVHLDTRSGTPAWKNGEPTAVWIY